MKWHRLALVAERILSPLAEGRELKCSSFPIADFNISVAPRGGA